MRLLPELDGRSEPSVEDKHANISAALLDAGLPYLSGYKPRSDYQVLLADAIAAWLHVGHPLLRIAEADADRPIAEPEVEDILAVLTDRPPRIESEHQAGESSFPRIRLTTNDIEREAA